MKGSKDTSALDRCVVAPDGKLSDVLRAIDEGTAGIAIVADRRRRVLGTVTDGDVRRALLGGATLNSPVAPYVQRRFISVGPQAARAEVLDLMQARFISQIPILDKQRRLMGLHLLREMLGGVERPNVAVVMAGGMGSRLRPATEHVPKPMLKVAGRPILERILLHLVGCGIRHVYLAIHYLGDVIVKHFGDGEKFGCRIEYLREKKPLGTGGALSLLRRIPADPLIVMNGDLITQADIPAMLRFHVAGGYAATMAVRRYGHRVPFGCVRARGGRVVRLEEKPLFEATINAGIYVLEPALIRKVPRRFFPITELFEGCLDRGQPVGAFEVEEEWLDVGQREQLREGRVHGSLSS